MTTPLDRVRETALTLPEVEEREVHGRPTFYVDGEPFAQFGGDGPAAVCVRTADAEEEALLIDRAPEVFARPSGDAPDRWVAMNLTGEVDWTLVDDRVGRSWELVAPRRLLEAGGR